MIDRAARLERIRVLLDERRHPERRIGIFSATNLTRLVLRLVLMGVVGGLAQRVLPSGPIGVTLTALAIGAADMAFGTGWGRVQAQVHRGFQAGTSVLVVVLLLGTLVVLLGPNSGIARGLRGAGSDFLAEQNARLDRRNRARGIVVDPAQASGADWQLLITDSLLVKGTYREAEAWCRELGPGWGLPGGLGNLPTLASWPTLERPVSVWAAGGSAIQVGDGQRPAVGSGGGYRDTEVKVVLCVQGAP